MKLSSSRALGLYEIRVITFSGGIWESVVLTLVDFFDEMFILDARFDLIFGHSLTINSLWAGMHPQIMETLISIKLQIPAST